MSGIEWRPIVDAVLPYLYLLGILLGGYGIGILISRIIRLFFKRFEFPALAVYKRYLRQPVRLMVSLIAVLLAAEVASLPLSQLKNLRLVLHVLAILDGIWGTIGILYFGEAYIKNRLRLDAEDNLDARKIYTQLGILRRIASFVVVILGLGILLTSFDGIRRLGTTLLASAGVVGIILGVAAQKTIGLVLAGLQVALTQPIRIDDVLIVEGEWGKVEEIALTYVVVKIWDERRLVLPISYFIEKPFQNWTRSDSRLIGSIYLYADYTLSADVLRQELGRILPDMPKWDKRVQVVQVTAATERGQELRILVSAKNAPLLWDLRCAVREKMVEFIQREYPEALPRVRAVLNPDEVS